MSTITACMIVRDEERVLRRCLKSIEDVCDELCIVDTGSRDSTPAIARRAHATFRHFTDCNDADEKIVDFSVARNAALELATSQWILWIDADEVLTSHSAKFIRACTRHEDVAGYSVLLRSAKTRWPAVRLFRRGPGSRFIGEIHEWVSVPGPIVMEPRIVIWNKPDKVGKESSLSRDLRICQAALTRRPKDTRMLLYFARALQNSGEYNDAIHHLRTYLDHEGEFTAGRHWATQSIAVCHLLSGRWRDARRWGRKALEIDDTKPESHCVVGDANLALGHFARAKRDYSHALGCPPPPLDYPMFVPLSFSRYWPTQRLREFFGRRGAAQVRFVSRARFKYR
jgi:glycosyltransferase involved in cell wall biosynthesis